MSSSLLLLLLRRRAAAWPYLVVEWVTDATKHQDKSEDIKRIIGELEDGPEGFVDVRKFEQAFTALLVRFSSSFDAQ
jgi:hypothetical protein